jgi:PIN domain nuclease of toxin-antitoxin system
LLTTAASSTVNLAEVQRKPVDRGLSLESAWAAALVPIQEAIPFTAEYAKAAGSMIAQIRALGLSLGDRSCLGSVSRCAHLFTRRIGHGRT